MDEIEFKYVDMRGYQLSKWVQKKKAVKETACLDQIRRACATHGIHIADGAAFRAQTLKMLRPERL